MPSTWDVDIIEHNNNYRIWDMGKPPDFVLEIASQNTADNDLHPKRELYAIIGIGEYWRYDPTPDSEFYGEPLVGEILVNDTYQRLPVAPDAEGRPPRPQPGAGSRLRLGERRPAYLRPGHWRMGALL